MADKEQNENRYISNSLIRGLEILNMFDAEHLTLSMGEVAQKMGVNRTVPFRLLYTLQTLGYLRQDETTKRYELTNKVLELGVTYLSSLPIHEIAEPYLEQLRDETNSSSHLGMLDDMEVVYVAGVPSKSMSSVNINIASRLPAYATAMGKCLLAFQPKERLEKILPDSDLTPLTPHTKSNLPELLQELDFIRQHGYALSVEEYENGVCSIAAPVLDYTGSTLAAINIAAPKSILNDDFITNVALPAVRRIADLLSSFMGYNGNQNQSK